jgi:hypothetical protein
VVLCDGMTIMPMSLSIRVMPFTTFAILKTISAGWVSEMSVLTSWFDFKILQVLTVHAKL